jgi:molecular chaperone DnaK (HSP70)
MPYVLGVDVGTNYTTAARCRDGEGASVLALDEDTPSVHSVLYLAADDSVLVGRDAIAMAQSDSERVARGFAARVGDPIPPLLGGRPCPAEMLLAALVSWVVDRAEEAEGDAPARVVLTHPSSWGTHRRTVLDQALRGAGLPDVLLLPKPVAAAENLAATHPVDDGHAVAVYDLGDQSLSCAVARLGSAGFELLSRAETTEHIAGTHFDDALVGHVLNEVQRPLTELDPFDVSLRPVLAELREDCRAAKETLSAAAETIIPTPRLGPPSSVLVSRAQFEKLISPAVYRGIDTLQQVIRASGASKVDAVALLGGSARVPLVAELVAAAGPVPVWLDPDPATAVARGAALAGQRVTRPAITPVTVVTQPKDEHSGVDVDAPTQPPRPPVEVAPLDVPRRRWKVASRPRAGRSSRRTG